MRRVPWSILFALLMGVGLGLGYTWVISPHPMMDAQPNALRGDFKDQYRSLIAAAYAATGNLPRAQACRHFLHDRAPHEDVSQPGGPRCHHHEHATLHVLWAQSL